MKVHYKHTQYGTFLIAFMLIIMLFLSYAYYFQIGTKPLPFLPYIVVMLLLLLSILFFYKLTLVIDDEKITAIFGIGVLKKSIAINEIKSIENFKIPWYTGIGIRLTPKGWLWNVATGNSVLIHGNSNTFLVGTDEVEKVITILKKIT